MVIGQKLSRKGRTALSLQRHRKLQNVESPAAVLSLRLAWKTKKGLGAHRGNKQSANECFGLHADCQNRNIRRREARRAWLDGSVRHYRAPSKATRAVVELFYNGRQRKSQWSNVSLAETAAPAPRKVRLAAVHYRPQGGKSMIENCASSRRLIEDAAKQHADLVCCQRR